MASIESYQTAKGRRYRVRWRWRERSYRQSGLPTLRDAKALQREVEAAVAQGRNWERPAGPVPQLGPALGEWLASLRRAGRSERTLQTYHDALEDFCGWLLKTHRRAPLLSDLTRQALEGWYDHKRLTCAANTASVRLSPVRSAWAWLWDRYPDEVPPAREVRVDPGRVAKAGRAPTWAHCDAMIPHLRPPFIDAAIVQRYTGLRVGQALRLEWADFDLDVDVPVMRIRPELGKTAQERRGRVVPIAPAFAEWLREQERKGGRVVPDGRKGPMTYSSVARTFRVAWQRSGIPPQYWKGQSSHAFRYAMITELRVRGIDKVIVQTLVGHASRDVTDGVYLDRLLLPIGAAVAQIQPIRSTGAVVSLGLAKGTGE